MSSKPKSIDQLSGEELVKLLSDAAEILNEVRTGEDFEVVCHEHAGKIEEVLETKERVKAFIQRHDGLFANLAKGPNG